MAEIECICEGNWRVIVEESEPYLGKWMIDEDGNRCLFEGVVWAADDFYYLTWNKEDGTRMHSCVMGLQSYGSEFEEEANG